MADGLMADIVIPRQRAALNLLGPFRIAIGGRDLHRLPRRADALLALLVLHQSRPLSREAVVDMLWPESGPEQGVTACGKRS